MLSFSLGFFSFEGNVKRAPWDNIFRPDFRIRDLSARLLFCQLVGNGLFGRFLVILDFTKDPDFHPGVPQTSLRDWAIVLTGYWEDV